MYARTFMLQLSRKRQWFITQCRESPNQRMNEIDTYFINALATAQILVAGIYYVGLIGKDETPVTGAKSNTTKPRRESCKADKIVSLVCGLESPLLHFSPLVTTLFFNHSVFWGPTTLLEHLVLLLPCANTLLVNTVCHKSIYSFNSKEGKKLLWCYYLRPVFSIITQSAFHFFWNLLS